MQNKIAVITNCSELQGPAIAAEFQRQGASLYLQDVDIEKAKQILAKHGLNLEDDVHFVQADFSERGDAEREISEVVAETGRLDILVINNFHEDRDKPLLGISDDEWDSVQHAVLTEPFYVTRAALRDMIAAKDGKIIIVALSSGLDDQTYKPCYTAATSGLVGFTRALGREVDRYNIQVNVIIQNGLQNLTDLEDDGLSQTELLKQIGRFVSTTHPAKGTELAKLAAFLASDDSDFARARIAGFTAGPRGLAMIGN